MMLSRLDALRTLVCLALLEIHVLAKYVIGESGSHARCALEICPAINASLACVPDHQTSQLLGKIAQDQF